MGLIGVFLNKGNYCLERGLFLEAIRYYLMGLSLDTDNPFATFNLGLAHIQQGDFDAGLDTIRKALVEHPALNKELSLDSTPDACIAALKTRLEKEPDAVASYPSVSGDRPEVAQREVERQQEMFGLFTAMHAELVHHEEIAREAYQEGMAFLDEDVYDEAIKAFGRAIEVDPIFASSHNGLGTAFLLQEEWALGLVVLKRAVRLKPDLAEAYVNLGVAHVNLGAYDEAVAAFQRALKLDPTLFSTHQYSNLGTAYYHLDDYEAALQAYQQALAFDPDDTIALMNIGAIYRDVGDHAAAVAHFERLLAHDPDFLNAKQCVVIGDSYMQLEVWPKAVTCLERAHTLEPITEVAELLAQACRHAGIACFDAEDYHGAVEYAHRSVALIPDSLDYAYDLGLACLFQRNLDEAIHYFEKVYDETDLDPPNPLIPYNLACAYALREDPENALSWLETAVETGFTDGEGAQTDADLASIRNAEPFQHLIDRMKAEG